MRSLAPLLALWLSACAALDVVAVGRACTTDAACGTARCVAGRCVADLPDAGADASSPVPYCDGSGPPILVSDSGRVICSGGIAESTFRFALCTCDGIVGAAPLRIDSFASEEGPYSPPGGRGGSFGCNSRVDLNADVDVGGSVWVAGDLVAGGAARLEVGTDLRVGGFVESAAALDVGRNADVGGSLRAASLRVGGTLRLPPGVSIDVPDPAVGAETRGVVSVPPPCGCGATDLVEVAALVRAHAMTNDDATSGFDPALLDGYVGPARIELPCGRLYAPRLAGSGDLTLVVTGRTALFVGGSVSFPASLVVELVGDAAELDLFVEGDFGAEGEVRLGDASRPARARLYVGGSGTIGLSGSSTFAGNLYAPRAELVAAGNVEVFGSVFVRRVSASGFLTLHYDTSVLRAGDACPPRDPPTCTSCLDCRNQACIGGTCGACGHDADCCAPLICVGGTCQLEPF